MRGNQNKLPNNCRAIVSGTIVTVDRGRRVVREYSSGEPLQGEIPEDDAPPFTGFVRGFGQRKKRS